MQVAAARTILDEYHAEDTIEKPTVERLDAKEKSIDEETFLPVWQ